MRRPRTGGSTWRRRCVTPSARRADRRCPVERWAEVFRRPPPERAPDVDEDLYGGFVGNDDRRALDRLRGMGADELAETRTAFDDARLEELVFRYRARNFAQTLSDGERARGRRIAASGCTRATAAGSRSRRTSTASTRWRSRPTSAGGRSSSALVDYAGQIAPPRD